MAEARDAFHPGKGLIEKKNVKDVIDTPGLDLTKENLQDAVAWDPEKFRRGDCKPFDFSGIYS